MTSRKKNPGGALQRTTGAQMKNASQRHSRPQNYTTCSDLQRRHLMRRCGIASLHGTTIADLFFGEDWK